MIITVHSAMRQKLVDFELLPTSKLYKAKLNAALTSIAFKSSNNTSITFRYALRIINCYRSTNFYN